MNEFTGKPKEFLKAIKSGLESYERGSTDAINVAIQCLLDIEKKTKEMYALKIAQCEDELNK